MVQRNRKTIKLYSPSVGKEELKNIEEVFNKGILTKGSYVKKLENKLKKFTGRKYALVFNSGTSALFAAYFSIDVRNKKILVPDYTFPATAVPALSYKAKIILGEVDLQTYNLNPSIINSSIDIVVCVDQFGFPCDYKKIYELKQQYNFTLIEDAACSIGSLYMKEPSGSFGEISIFSFHPRKLITTGEGGALLTDNEMIYEKAKSLRDHNIIEGNILSPGFNFRMSDINAAIGIAQFSKLRKIIQKRRKIYNIYIKKLNGIVSLQKPVMNAVPNYQSFVVNTKIPAKVLIKELKKRKIDSVRGNYSLSELSIFQRCDFLGDKTPSHTLSRYSIALPLHEKMTEEDANHVADNFIEIVKTYSQNL